MIDQILGEFYYDKELLKKLIKDSPEYFYPRNNDSVESLIGQISTSMSVLIRSKSMPQTVFQGKILSKEEIINFIDSHKEEIGSYILDTWKYHGNQTEERDLMILFKYFWFRRMVSEESYLA